MGITPGLLGTGRLRRLDLGGFDGISYYLNGTLQVDGELTLDPGVTIKFAPRAPGLVIRGALSAEGYADARIVFTSLHDDCEGNPADTSSDGWMSGPCPGDTSALPVKRR